MSGKFTDVPHMAVSDWLEVLYQVVLSSRRDLRVPEGLVGVVVGALLEVREDWDLDVTVQWNHLQLLWLPRSNKNKFY